MRTLERFLLEIKATKLAVGREELQQMADIWNEHKGEDTTHFDIPRIYQFSESTIWDLVNEVHPEGGLCWIIQEEFPNANLNSLTQVQAVVTQFAINLLLQELDDGAMTWAEGYPKEAWDRD